MAWKPTIAGVLAGLTLLTAACGGDDDDAAVTSAAPSAATDAAGAPTIAAPTAPSATAPAAGSTEPGSAPAADGPERIVSLSATHTEMLFAIGAGDQVVAVDSTSNFPPEAEAVMTDLSAYTPNVEAIAGYEPDLVITSGGDDLTAELDALGIDVWVGEAATTFEESYDQIEQLGAITGHVGEAAELVGQMQADIEEIEESMPAMEVPLTVYHELDDTLYSANSSTFIGHVYESLGLRNIADAAEDVSGYPQLSAEAIIAADPDLIFLADTNCCGQSLETVRARPGWDAIAAVADGNVFAMDDDIASRWGPRVVEYMQQVRDAVDQVLVPAGG